MTKRIAKPTELLTLPQLAVLVAIRDHVRTHRIPPTHAELAGRLGVTRPNVSQIIYILRRKGAINYMPDRIRTLTITRAGHAEANKPRTLSRS